MKSLRTNFWLDAVIFGGTLAALQPRATGNTVHEWLGAAFAAALTLHVALHWDWAVGVTRSFFRNLFHVSRLNYILGALLFVAFTVVMTSGLAISRVVVPSLGIQLMASRSWLEIHNISANLTLLLVGLHFALHWSWVKSAFARIVLGANRGRSPAGSREHSLPVRLNDVDAVQ